MHNYRINLNKFGYLFLTVVFLAVYIVTSCIPIKVNPEVIITGTPTKTDLPTKDITLTPIPSPTLEADLPQKDKNLIDLNLLEAGEYIVIRDKWAGGKNALYVISPDGDLIGMLATGHYFDQAAISPDHKWLAYDENAQSFLLNLGTSEVIELDEGCESPSWAPDSPILITACKTVLLSYEFINGHWAKTGTLLPPNDFSQYPPEVLETMHLQSPVWSPDGQKIAYFINLEVLRTNSGIGPFISTKSCLQGNINCETYSLSINQIHTRGKLYWLQDPLQLAIYSIFDDEPDLYIYSIDKTNTRINRFHLTEGELIESFAFSSDNQLIAYRPYSGSVYLFNINTGEKIKIYNGLNWEQMEVLFWLKITNGQ